MSYRRVFLSAIFLLISSLAIPSQAAIELLVNGGFENQPNFGSGVTNDAGYSELTGSQIPGWTIEPNHAVTIHNTFLYPTITGSYSVNTDGEGHGGNNANFYQDFATTLGQSYQFSYDWQGWMNNAPSTLLNVSIVDAVTSASIFANLFAFSSALNQESATIVGTGNPFRLRIQHTPQSGFNDNQFIVDNFSVLAPDAAAVPEPTTLTLWTLGVVGCAISAYRRRRRAA